MTTMEEEAEFDSGSEEEIDSDSESAASGTEEEEIDADSGDAASDAEEEEIDADSGSAASGAEDEEIDADSGSAASGAEDEDEFLLELFASGKLQSGLNVPKKQFVNNVQKLKELTTKCRLELPWIETKDIVNDVAEMAPELAMEMKEQEELVKSGKSNSLSLNEFKRETLFHRQAQLAAIEGIARLKSLGIPTTRPDDYFAEMMKSDGHMQKVRRTLLEKQAALKTREKVREIREHKKVAKQKQVESTLRKQKEKRNLNEEIKKYRKGMRTDLDFLERGGEKNENKKTGKSWKKDRFKRKENLREEDDGKQPKNFRGKKNFGGKQKNYGGKQKNFGGKSKGPVKNSRPGKDRRKNMKNKKR